MTIRPYFSHAGVHLRFPRSDDLGSLLELRNEFGTWSNLTDPRPIGPGDQKAWLESLGLRSGRYYFIACSDEHPFVGLVRMDEHDLVNRSVRVGADVVHDLRGQGWGTRIYQALERYCFDYLNVHRMWLLVLETNVRALHLYEKRGFIVEGKLRQAVYRDGRYVDYIVMSLLQGGHR
jgi:RimJ/RimL family protein N-acetyltransferase